MRLPIARVLLVTSCALALLACSDDPAQKPQACEANGDCAPGEACVDNACLPTAGDTTGPGGSDTTDAVGDSSEPLDSQAEFDIAAPDATDAGGLLDIGAVDIAEPVDGIADVGPPQPDVDATAPDADTTAPTDGCTSHGDCPSLQLCNATTPPGFCTEPPICLSDADCLFGRVCDRGACADEWSGCTTDLDCDEGECSDEQHECVDVEPCGDDMDCVGGVCEKGACVECRTVADCGSALMKCVGNLCYEPSACTAAKDCFDGALCTSGQCTQPIYPDDAFENNDVPVAAKSVPAGLHEGLTIQSWDDDWYAVNVPAGSSVVARIRFDDASGDLDLALLDASGGHLLAEDATQRSFAIVGTSGWSTPTTVLLHVMNTDGTVPSYDLAVFLPAKDVCIPDAADAASPAGSPETAMAIEGPEWTSHGASICAGESDWYRVQTSSTSTLSAAIRYPIGLGALDVLLHDADLNLLSGTSAPSEFEFASAANVPASTFYVEVRGEKPNDHNGYELTVKSVSSSSCQFDAFELNDQPAAAPLFEGTNQQLTLCPGDEDWFATTVPAGMGLEATLTYTNFESQLAVEIIDDDGVSVLGQDTGATFPKGLKTQAAGWEQAPKTKTVYTRIRRIEPLDPKQFTPYTLKVEVVPGFCDDDAGEPDSTWPLARPLKVLPGQSNAGKICPGDAGDFYTVELDGGNVLTLDLAHDVDDAALSLSLLQPDGVTEVPLTQQFFNTIGKFAIFDATKSASISGTWFVRVSGAAASPYSLVAVRADKLACPVDDAYEPNDTAFSSKPLPLGSTVSAYLCTNNPDVFHMQTGLGTGLTLALTMPAETPKVIVQLHGPDLQLAYAETVTKSGDIGLTEYVLQSGTWFLSFRSPIKGTYSIKVTNAP